MSASQFLSILIFMLVFNMLIGYYAISEVSVDSNIALPEFPDDPGVVDYVLIPFSYIGLFFKLVFFTISELPTFMSVFVVIIDLTLAYILIRLARGGG